MINWHLRWDSKPESHTTVSPHYFLITVTYCNLTVVTDRLKTVKDNQIETSKGIFGRKDDEWQKGTAKKDLDFLSCDSRRMAYVGVTPNGIGPTILKLVVITIQIPRDTRRKIPGIYFTIYFMSITSTDADFILKYLDFADIL